MLFYLKYSFKRCALYVNHKILNLTKVTNENINRSLLISEISDSNVKVTISSLLIHLILSVRATLDINSKNKLILF